MTVSDEDLAIRANSGDPIAWQEFFYRWNWCLVAFIRKRIRSHEDAEEIAVETWFRFWKSPYDPSRKCKVSTYLFFIANHLIIDYLRRQPNTATGASGIDLADPSPGPTKNLEQLERLEELRHCLEGLDSEEKEILRLRYDDDLSNEEVSESIGTSVGSVRGKLQRAIRKLRDCMGLGDS